MMSSTGFAATLRLELSGTAYQGGPAFEVAVGNRVVGRGTVDPLPASGQGTTFEFEVPDLLLVGNPDIRLRLTNDAWAGPGDDRNLYLLGVAVNGETVPLETFSVRRNGEPRSNRLRRGHLEIWSGQEVAIASAPTGGWSLAAPPFRPALALVTRDFAQ